MLLVTVTVTIRASVGRGSQGRRPAPKAASQAKSGAVPPVSPWERSKWRSCERGLERIVGRASGGRMLIQKVDHQLCFNLVPLFAAWMKCSVTLNISYPTQTALLWRN